MNANMDWSSGRIVKETNGPTETVERLNRAYPLTELAESRMR